MIKAVVFDLDDTLISEREYIKSGFKVVSKEIEKKYKLNKDIINKKLNELFEIDSKNVFNRFLDLYEIKYEKKDIMNLIKIYREHNPEITFFDDVIITLTELRNRGYKLGIITDGYKETQRRKIEALKCIDIFDEIIITDELGREFWKPHKKSYILISERLNVKQYEIAYIGDNLQKDFITANKLSMFTIQINRDNCIYKKNNFEKNYLAMSKVSKLNEVINLLEKSKDEENELFSYYTNV